MSIDYHYIYMSLSHSYLYRGAYEYRLSLNSDLYSTKHTQWFYFKVEGMVSMTTYTFHIINFYKPDSLYNYGNHVMWCA